MAGPLSHIRVIDLSRVLAAPWTGQNLADLGADVIKIERPKTGDDSRAFGPPWLKDASGKDTTESAYFASANRGKKSVTVNLSKPEGQDIVRRIAAQCDVLLENYKFGDLARYGLGYEDLRKINPRLIYCSVTGFGQTGPYAERPGYDFMIQGMAGLMSITGERDDLPGGGPQKAGIPIGDIITGMYASVAVCAALAHRERSGTGQHLDLALLDSLAAILSQPGRQLSRHWRAARTPGQRAPQHRALPDLQDGGRRHHPRVRQRQPLPQVLRSRRLPGARRRSALRDQRQARREPDGDHAASFGDHRASARRATGSIRWKRRACRTARSTI